MDSKFHITEDDIKETLNIEDESKKGKKGYIKYIIIGVVLILIAGVFFVKSANNKQKFEFITTKIEKKDIVITVSATGNLEPTNSVDVGIEVSGTIKDVLVDFNDKVKKDQILAVLDTTKLEASVTNYEAGLNVAKANLFDSKVVMNYTKSQYESYNEMWKSNKKTYPSKQVYDKAKQDYDRATATYNASKAKVEQAQAQLNTYKDDLKKAIIKAPFDGIILDKKIDVGQSVVASMTVPVLFTIAEDLSKMEVVVSVDEADVGRVKEGQQVTFSVDTYPSKVFYGEIKKVRLNSKIISGVVTYETVVEVDNSEYFLKPGMTANTEIIAKTIKDVDTIPNAALRFSPNDDVMKAYNLDSKTLNTKSYIWILKDTIPTKVEVTIGDSDGEITQLVDNTLSPDTQVITNIKE